MTHLTDPPAYRKTPNRSPIDPRKQAQELMNAAENRTTSLNDTDCCARAGCCEAPEPEPSSLTAESVQLGTINVTVVTVDGPFMLVDLPELPDGTAVKAQEFTVERGLATVIVSRRHAVLEDGPQTWWGIRPVSHEGFNSSNAGQDVPFLDTVHGQRFETVELAVAYAVKWLDALDAWFAAVETATANIAETIG